MNNEDLETGGSKRVDWYNHFGKIFFGDNFTPLPEDYVFHDLDDMDENQDRQKDTNKNSYEKSNIDDDEFTKIMIEGTRCDIFILKLIKEFIENIIQESLSLKDIKDSIFNFDLIYDNEKEE